MVFVVDMPIGTVLNACAHHENVLNLAGNQDINETI
jgi:hypothetical protein